MEDSNEDYDTFEQYNYNKSVYEQVRGNIGDELDLFPHEILTEETENNYNITKDCAKLSKYLKNFHSREGCQTQNCCQYINYILNEKVRRDYDSKESIFDIYKRYMNHKVNSIIKNLCSTEINYMLPEKYKKVDFLYKAYKTCQLYISNEHDSTSCSYAKYCYRAYNNIMTEYKKRDDTKFCKTLNNLKDLLEAKELPQTLICDSSFSGSLPYPDDCTELQKKSKEIKESMEITNMGLKLPGALGESSEGKRQEISEVVPPGVPEQGVKESPVGVPEGGIKMQETVSLIPAPAGANDISAESPSAKTPTPVGTIIGTSLGFVLPLITIYRFTPFGNWVNTRVLGRDKLMDNMKKNELEFLLNNAQTQDVNSGDTIYRIKYNSVLNE